jgi:nucleoside 2-deoxyribosyltransferase
MKDRPRVYLAGPDVFLRNPEVIAEAKQKLCENLGFTAVSPSDNVIDIRGLAPREAAFKISEANEEMIRGCNLVVANLTPFRGPSADVGTVFELGFARGLGLPVFAYTNVADSLLERTRELLGDQVRERASAPGRFEDHNGMAIESFGLADNLMLEGAVRASGAELIICPTPHAKRFTDLSGFDLCLRQAAVQLKVWR